MGRYGGVANYSNPERLTTVALSCREIHESRPTFLSTVNQVLSRTTVVPMTLHRAGEMPLPGLAQRSTLHESRIHGGARVIFSLLTRVQSIVHDGCSGSLGCNVLHERLKRSSFGSVRDGRRSRPTGRRCKPPFIQAPRLVLALRGYALTLMRRYPRTGARRISRG